MDANNQDTNDIAEAKQAYQAYLAHHAETPAPPATMGSYARQALDAVGRTLGYAGGVARTSVANLHDLTKPIHEAMTGEEDPTLSRDGDLLRALKGNAPSSAEYMDRAGVPAGPSLSDAVPSMYAPKGTGGMFTPEKGGALDPTARGAAGFVADAVTDPLTYASMGLSNVARAGKFDAPLMQLLKNGEYGTAGGKAANIALNPVEVGLRNAGNKVYDSAFSRVDQALAQKGEAPISPIFKEHDFVGGPNAAFDKAQEWRQAAGKGTEVARNAVQDAGWTGSLPTNMQNVDKLVARLRKSLDPADHALADKLEETAMHFSTNPNPLDMDTIHTNKTIAADKANSTYKNPFSSARDKQDALLQKYLGGELGSLEEKGVQSTLGDEALSTFQKNKSDYGALDEFTQQRLLKNAAREENRTGVLPSAVDAFGWAKALISQDPSIAAGMLAKKGVDVSRMTLPRTAAGLTMLKGGENSFGLLDSGVRPLWEKMLMTEEAKQKDQNK